MTPGATKEDAFRIGMEMADEITQLNPSPMKLKFEKVYLPCVLITKKRYVGFKYESLEQKEPDFDAKGIETVRRDTCPAVAKILERCLKILFRTQDVLKVKEYLVSEFIKIQTENIPVTDFFFAKEVKLGHYRYRCLN